MNSKRSIYLNNAATGYPKPDNVLNAVHEYLRRVPSSARRSGVKDGEDILAECRHKLAALFHAPEAEQMVFTAGGTESLNLAILGSTFKDSHIITTTTEHNSVLRPLKKLEADGVIQLSIVACNAAGEVTPLSVANALRENTRAVILNHCSNVTGRVLDLHPFAEIAHTHRALFIVDASQSAGLTPIDVQADGIDMLAFTGHKSLHGLPGIGGLFIRNGLWPTPLKFGGTGVKSQLLTFPPTMPLYYEAGTPNTVGIVSLSAGIDYILATGMEEIRKKKEYWVSQFYNELKDLPRVIFYGKAHSQVSSTVICFNIEGLPTEDLGYILENSFHMIIRAGLHCAPLIHAALGSFPQGSVRLSPSFFTTQAEIEQAIAAVRQICLGAKVNHL